MKVLLVVDDPDQLDITACMLRAAAQAAGVRGCGSAT
jgi:hypothetical protein